MKEDMNDFGKFLTDLAKSETAVSHEALENIKAKFQKEKEADIEARLRDVYISIQRTVAELRAIREAEKSVKARLKQFEQDAKDIVAGKSTLTTPRSEAILEPYAKPLLSSDLLRRK